LENRVKLAIFDLDNTLLNGDSDYLWGQFLVDQGIINQADFERDNQRFYEDYQAGCLDIQAYLQFALRPLAQNDMETLLTWHAQFMDEYILPIILPKGRALIEQHKNQGDYPMIITATNAFITAPIGRYLGVETTLATQPELVADQYTGKYIGTPTFREGKVKRLKEWLEETGHNLEGAVFYSDSHNDLPLLEMVERPVAVDPDAKLKSTAQARGWEIISLRE
jgi:HAD superfamily hydrolase (TIGR01490 family)